MDLAIRDDTVAVRTIVLNEVHVVRAAQNNRSLLGSLMLLLIAIDTLEDFQGRSHSMVPTDRIIEDKLIRCTDLVTLVRIFLCLLMSENQISLMIRFRILYAQSQTYEIHLESYAKSEELTRTLT